MGKRSTLLMSRWCILVLGLIAASCGGSPAPVASVEPAAPEASPEPEAPTAPVELQLFSENEPGPALLSDGRVIAGGRVVGAIQESENGVIRFVGVDGQARAWLGTDGAIQTPLSTLDARVDEEHRLVFGEDAIFIEETGGVSGSVARQGLRFEGVHDDNRRRAIFMLVMVISMSTPTE